MKHIVKVEEPVEFLEWKKKDKMFLRGKPNWDRLHTNIKEILREVICKEQGYICCYCERELNENDYHLEHLKPKDKNKFPEIQLEYNNLLCSCQLELEKGEPRHCGNSKGSWFQEENFISPLSLDCEGKFKYTIDGHIEAANELDDAAIITIEKLKLGIDKLNKMREKAIEPFIDDILSPQELNDFVTEYLVEKDGKYNPFYSTIKYLFVS
jgi:uncharacterized protein (TIGR02646 family)